MPQEHRAGFELLGTSLVSYPGMPQGWLHDPLLTGQTIEAALRTTGVQTDASRAIVAINPPGLVSEQTEAIITLAEEPMTVKARDLSRLQHRALDQALSIDRDPLLVERVNISGNGFEGVRDPRGLSATRLHGTFHLVTMPTAVQRRVVQAVESAGLEVTRLTWTLPAALAAPADPQLLQQRVLVMDAGGLTTSIGLFVEGALSVSITVEEGGMHVAHAIAAAMHVTVEQAIALSFEASASRKPEVRDLIEQSWTKIQAAIAPLLADQPRPDVVLLTGRGALLDGFVEWIEGVTGLQSVVCRSPHTQRVAELSRQVGLAPALGLLEQVTRTVAGPFAPRSPRLVDRVLAHTRTILTEYF